MPAALNVPSSVLEFLKCLELELKQIPGISPEEALSDAREFLMSDFAALDRSGEPLRNELEQRQWIRDRYGDPKQVASQYGEAVIPAPESSRMGFAPGWRICCTRCGRSAPLAHIGAIRIGARSYHKYKLGFCSSCNGLRFCRIIRDLYDTNLTRKLCKNQTTDELRQSMHRPKTVIASILMLVAGILLVCFGMVAAASWFISIGLTQETQTSQTEAVLKLREAVLNQYSYRDLRRVDWEKRFEEFSPKLESASSRELFAKHASELLSVAKDVHIWMRYDGKTIGTFQPSARPNFNPRILPKLLKSIRQHGKTVLTGMASETIHYVAIATWDHREPESMKAAFEAVERAAIVKAPIIIDVRPNSGGDEEQAKKIASHFVKAAMPYAKHRNWSDGKLGESYTRAVVPNEKQTFHPGPCVVLMGPANMSSCESFLLMMKTAKANLIGSTSFGTSGNPKPYDLGNGVTLFLPSWQMLDLDGNLMEGKGIEPDIVVEAKDQDFSLDDPVLAKAIAILSSQR